MGLIEDQIIKATDESLSRPDNELIAKIIQYIEDHPEHAQDATNALKERLEEK